jgi:ATP-binding cassette, subfamily B, bacterial
LSVSSSILGYDLKNAISSNRLVGLWRLMAGFRLKYVGATLSLGISATSKTATYLLLRYFIDNYFGDGNSSI